MRSAANKEMEYLGANQGRNTDDENLVRELGRRLESLRRYDQFFCSADWHPKALRTGGDTVRKELES